MQREDRFQVGAWQTLKVQREAAGELLGEEAEQSNGWFQITQQRQERRAEEGPLASSASLTLEFDSPD